MIEKNILIIGGGTGGHISPGLALYEKFKEKDSSVYFISGKRDRRFSSLKDVAPGDLFYYGAPTFTKNIIKLPFFLIRFTFAWLKAKRIMKKLKINMVIGMGGYVSAPALLAAKSKKISIYLCEQNSIPGKVTSLFEKYAERIYATFQVSKEHLKDKGKFYHAGNPIRDNVLKDINREEAKKAFHLTHSKKVILVIGGSQGALKINELIFGLKKEYAEDFQDVGIIWSTGSFSYNKFKELMHNEMDEGSIYLSPYINRVGMAYRACDIAISRSGAGVMMELAAMGIPSIQIPYPYAAMNHQESNADAFVKEGAALKIMDKEAVPEIVAPIVTDLLNNPRELQKMSDRARSLSKRDASDIIVNDILEMRL